MQCNEIIFQSNPLQADRRPLGFEHHKGIPCFSRSRRGRFLAEGTAEPGEARSWAREVVLEGMSMCVSDDNGNRLIWATRGGGRCAGASLCLLWAPEHGAWAQCPSLRDERWAVQCNDPGWDESCQTNLLPETGQIGVVVKGRTRAAVRRLSLHQRYWIGADWFSEQGLTDLELFPWPQREKTHTIDERRKEGVQNGCHNSRAAALIYHRPFVKRGTIGSWRQNGGGTKDRKRSVYLLVGRYGVAGAGISEQDLLRCDNQFFAGWPSTGSSPEWSPNNKKETGTGIQQCLFDLTTSSHSFASTFQDPSLLPGLLG
jgi:hypothetical protein